MSKRSGFLGRFGLWVTIVAVTFGLLVATILVSFLLAILFSRLGWFGFTRSPVFEPFFLLSCVSILFGTGLSAWIFRNTLRPLFKLSEATKEVARGNFGVRVHYDGKHTELQNLTQSFNRMAHELGNIEMMRSDFISEISHEFKTPIASIEGCAMLLQNDSLTSEERREYAELISQSSHRLSVLTSNILKLSRLEKQEIVTDRRDFRLDEQIRLAVLMLESEWTTRSIDLDIRLDELTWYGNEELLMQVWVNLIGNAIKFSNPGGTVQLTLRRDGAFLNAEVRDYGIGMTEEVQKHVFEKFYQGDKTRSDRGNGLGLALVQRIVELCDGEILVESVPGRGSCFTVKLPAEPVAEVVETTDIPL
jgi:signal transduction histidine kinase